MYYNAVGQCFCLPERPLEPPADVVIGYCPICKDEVYIGENVYDIDGKYIHEECIGEFAKDYFAQYLIRV